MDPGTRSLDPPRPGSPLPLSRAVSGYLLPWTGLDWPVAWEGIFGRSAPLGVELGFGGGEFLEREARDSPGIDWIGVERSWPSLRRLLRRVASAGVPNVRVVDGDAAVVLERLFAPGSIDRVIANHSDPWPKKSHHRRRLIQPRMIRILAERLRPGGRATIVTDHAEYAEWIAEVLAGESRLRSIHPTPWVDAIPGRSPTRYEHKALAAGVPVRYFVWERVEGEIPPPRIERMDAMPNVELQGPVDLDAVLARALPASLHEPHEGDPVMIRLEAAYRRGDGREWVVECRLDEGGFRQHFLISASPRDGERLVLQPSPVGSPRPTWGVRRGVRLLARLLLEGAPALRAVSTSVGPP
jgi:tRNA (guanine-N7-)-methyltransferase